MLYPVHDLSGCFMEHPNTKNVEQLKQLGFLFHGNRQNSFSCIAKFDWNKFPLIFEDGKVLANRISCLKSVRLFITNKYKLRTHSLLKNLTAI
jgi:hypothetical protein